MKLQIVDDLICATLLAKRKKEKHQCLKRIRDMYRNGDINARYMWMQCIGFKHVWYQELCRASEAAETLKCDCKGKGHTSSKRKQEDDASLGETQDLSKKQKKNDTIKSKS